MSHAFADETLTDMMRRIAVITMGMCAQQAGETCPLPYEADYGQADVGRAVEEMVARGYFLPEPDRFMRLNPALMLDPPPSTVPDDGSPERWMLTIREARNGKANAFVELGPTHSRNRGRHVRRLRTCRPNQQTDRPREKAF